MANAISVAGLVKTFGRTRALAGVDLKVRFGEVHGFLGPNAGKCPVVGRLFACAGRVSIDEPGRWFLYLEVLDATGTIIEAWLPALAPEPAEPTTSTTKHDWAYHPAGTDGPTPGQVIAGVLLYALVPPALFLLRVASRAQKPRGAGRRWGSSHPERTAIAPPPHTGPER